MPKLSDYQQATKAPQQICVQELDSDNEPSVDDCVLGGPSGPHLASLDLS